VCRNEQAAYRADDYPRPLANQNQLSELIEAVDLSNELRLRPDGLRHVTRNYSIEKRRSAVQGRTESKLRRN
jgi:hypothetical protein